MPKALKVHPGERVDLQDYVLGANDYTKESQKFLLEREILDRRARIFDGFKVRVEDQVLNPGLVTVFNGNAVDRSGQTVNNEDTADDSRSVTLLGTNTSFYIEIEYTEAPSDTDARYFWDPTTANSPPIPDGSEFLLNVATRISPDWRIVTPVSTTGFAQASLPNSTRIPLCVLRTNGSNQITTGVDNPGLVFVTSSSVLEYDLSPGVTQFRVFDARTMPVPPFSVTIGFGGASPEARTVTSVDRNNNILTVSAATATTHAAGAIVKVVGLPLFVQDKTDPNYPQVPLHPDLAQRMWQADEIRGSGLLQSKETFGARDDLNLRCLKDEVDFLSAQIREMKFGHPRSDTTSAAPPFSFNSRPRYFDQAGSIQGARSNTLSIGNGSTSFGDFNGSNDLVFIAAINALPPSGGTIFVKSGTYTFFSTVAVGKNVTIIGENFNSTSISNRVPAGAPFSFTADASIENITISQGSGGAYIALDLAGTVTLTLNYCAILAAIRLNGAVSPAIVARRSLLSNNDAGIGLITQTGGATLSLSRFDACSFTNLVGPVFSTGINSATVTNSFIFAVSVITPASVTAAVNNVTIQNCDITVTASLLFSYGTQPFSNIRVLNNQIVSLTLPSGFAVCWFTSTATLSNFLFADNSVSVSAVSGTYVSPSAVVSTAAAAAISNVWLHNNSVVLPSNSTAWAVFYVSDAPTTSVTEISITGNHLLRGNSLVRLGSALAQMLTGNYLISENFHNNSASTESAIGVEFYNTINPPRPASVNIINNSFFNYTHSTGAGGNRIGIECTFISTAYSKVNVENNLFYSFGTSTVNSASTGISFSPVGSTLMGSLRVVGNKLTYLTSVNNDCVGIYIRPLLATNKLDVLVSNNCIQELGKVGIANPVNAFGILLDTVFNATVSDNYVYSVGTDVGDGACLLLNSVGANPTDPAGVVVTGNRLFHGYTALASVNNGYNISVTGSCANLNIANNVCSQFGASGKANYGISIASCESSIISNNIVTTGTNASAGLLGSFGIYANGTLVNFKIASNIVDLFNTSWVRGLSVGADGLSSSISVDNNSIREKTLVGGSARVAMYVNGGVTGSSLTRAVAVRNNTITGAKSGLATLFRIGLYVNDCGYSTVSSNVVDWLYPVIAKGVGIQISASNLLNTWNHISCIGNLVTNDGDLATADISLDEINIVSLIAASNAVGDVVSPGMISPALLPTNWQYGTNLVN